MNSLIWLIAIFAVQAIIAGLAKKAQQKQEAERQARARSGQPGQPGQSSTTARPAASTASDDPIEVARREIEAEIASVRTDIQRDLDTARRPIDAQVAAPQQPRIVRAPVSNTVNPAVPTRPVVTVARAPQTAAKPRVLARGGAQPQQPASRPKVIARASSPKPAPATQRIAVQPSAPVREEAAAMASRARVAASIEAVRAAERKVDSAIVTKAPAAAQLGRPAVAITPASITAAMRNPARIREAFVIAEVLQGPRSMRAF